MHAEPQACLPRFWTCLPQDSLPMVLLGQYRPLSLSMIHKVHFALMSYMSMQAFSGPAAGAALPLSLEVAQVALTRQELEQLQPGDIAEIWKVRPYSAAASERKKRLSDHAMCGAAQVISVLVTCSASCRT